MIELDTADLVVIAGRYSASAPMPHSASLTSPPRRPRWPKPGWPDRRPSPPADRIGRAA